MKGLRWNVRNREVSDLQRCPLVQVLLYVKYKVNFAVEVNVCNKNE